MSMIYYQLIWFIICYLIDMVTALPSEEKPESTQYQLKVTDLITSNDTNKWFKVFFNASKRLILNQFELMFCLITTVLCTLLLLIIYNYLCGKCRKVAFIARLNEVERCLLSYHFHNQILKQEVDMLRTRVKEQSLDVRSSLEIVQSVETSLIEKSLRVSHLEKELENLQKDLTIATECGQQLHQNATHLLERNADEYMLKKDLKSLIKQSVEQNGILHDIKEHLCFKPQKDFEIQNKISSNIKSFTEDLKSLQKLMNGVRVGKSLEKQLIAKDHTIQELKQELQQLNSKIDMKKNQHQISLAKIEILERTLKSLRTDSELNLSKVIDAVNAQSELFHLKETHAVQLTRLTKELESKESLEQQLKTFNKKFKKLKKDFETLKSSKLELQISLDAFKNLFNDKEIQMNKQLVEKEVMCLRQQDEIKLLKTKIQENEESFFQSANETTKSMPPFLLPLPPILLPVIKESGSRRRTSTIASKTFNGNRFNSKSVDSIPRSAYFRYKQKLTEQMERPNTAIPHQTLPSSHLSSSYIKSSHNYDPEHCPSDQTSRDSSPAPTVIEIYKK